MPSTPLVRPRVRNIPELVGCIEVVVEEVVGDADGLRTVITVVKALSKDKKKSSIVCLWPQASYKPTELTSETVMGNYFNKFILLDVSMEISPPQFYLGKIVHRKIELLPVGNCLFLMGIGKYNRTYPWNMGYSLLLRTYLDLSAVMRQLLRQSMMLPMG